MSAGRQDIEAFLLGLHMTLDAGELPDARTIERFDQVRAAVAELIEAVRAQQTGLIKCPCKECVRAALDAIGGAA